MRSRLKSPTVRLRRILLAWLVGVGSLSLGAADERPNFLVLLCDDLGYGDLSSYGHPHIQTPNLDALAREGIRFTDCYAAAPVCSPSRAGLLTGRTPNRTGVYDWIPGRHVMHLPPEETTVATLLREAGYATCHAGKWHLNGLFNSDEQPQPDDHGFDHWFATQNNASPSHEDPRNFVRNGRKVGLLDGFSCQRVADEAIGWLRARPDREHPFFLNVWFHEPHEPVASPEELVRQYQPAARNENEAQYFANVANIDRAVGRIIEALDDLGLSERTLVFFSSDNGPETLRRYRNAARSYGSPGPLRGMKLHIYDGGIRVPGILRWTGRIQPGQTVRTPVSSVDLLPTFCELAGISLPAGKPLDGASWRPLFDAKSIERSKPLFWSYYRALSAPKVALRDGDWKIVAHWSGPADPLGGNVNPDSMELIKTAALTRFELYNIAADIDESENLATAEPQRLERMRRQISQLFREVQVEGPIWTFERSP